MTKFKLSVMAGIWGKKLGKEEVFIEFSEMDMLSIMKALQHWNKALYIRVKQDLITESINEGYDISFVLPEVKVRCPKCKEIVDL